MSLLDACKWLETTWLSTTIRHSKWGFALIEMAHLLGLALLGATLLIAVLRGFGLIFKTQRSEAMTRDLGWVLALSLTGLVVSGFLLFADGPLRYYANVAFRWKLLLLAAAMATGLGAHLMGVRSASDGGLRMAVKVAALLSGTLFFGVAVAGRVIGVL